MGVGHGMWDGCRGHREHFHPERDTTAEIILLHLQPHVGPNFAKEIVFMCSAEGGSDTNSFDKGGRAP